MKIFPSWPSIHRQKTGSAKFLMSLRRSLKIRPPNHTSQVSTDCLVQIAQTHFPTRIDLLSEDPARHSVSTRSDTLRYSRLHTTPCKASLSFQFLLVSHIRSTSRHEPVMQESTQRTTDYNLSITDQTCRWM